jgi:selenocysteine lyase/cysteine desulfurase
MYVAPPHHAGQSIEEPGLNRLGSENFEGNLAITDVYKPGARRYDVASKGNFGLLPGLCHALEQLESWGIASVERTLTSMTRQIADRLQSLAVSGVREITAQSHYVGVNVAEHRRKSLAESLARAGIHASVRGEWLRVTPHVYNSQHDIDRLIEAVCDHKFK